MTTDIYDKNMAALRQADPTIAEMVAALPEADRLERVPTRSGHLTAKVNGVWLASPDDPVEEARRLLAGVPIGEKFCFVIGGLGLGFHCRVLRELVKYDPIMIVSEPSIAVIDAALRTVDLSWQLATARLILMPELDKARLHERMGGVMQLAMIGAQFIAHPPSQRIAGPFHAQVRQLWVGLGSFVRMGLNTTANNAPITCRNMSYNLPTYLSTPPVDICKEGDRFAGVPGIVVSAGPSLAKNMHLLNEAKGHAVICATQTVFKPLLDAGIRPDFVTALDYHEKSKNYFGDTGDVSDIHMIAEPKVTWHVVDAYTGPISLLNNAFMGLLLGPDIGDRQGIPAGTTVAHLSLFWLQYLGCDPIIFIGQDMAYADGEYYPPQVWAAQESWREPITKPPSRIVKDVNGKDIETDELLATYHEQFERDLADATQTIINATEGGWPFEGVPNMTFRQALDDYCAEPLRGDCFAYRNGREWRDYSKLDEASKELGDRLDDFAAYEEMCRKVVRLLSQMRQLSDSPTRFNRRVEHVRRLRARLEAMPKAHTIATYVAQLGELQLFATDQKMLVCAADGPERARRQIARDLAYIQAKLAATKDARDMLTKARGRIADFVPRTALDTRCATG